LRGAVSGIVDQLADRKVKGEITLVVHGATGDARVSDEQLSTEIRRLTDEQVGVKEIAELLGERYGLAKREVYRLALEIKGATRAK